MRKDNTNFASGFTIAEVLISLLITAVIATAMVPVIGLKKVRNPISRSAHGIAECYYEPANPESTDENGNYYSWKLKYFYATRGNNGTIISQEVADGKNYCSLTLPTNANYYQIITIGAGGDGYDSPSHMGLTYKADEHETVSGFVRVDKNYISDINNASVTTVDTKTGKKNVISMSKYINQTIKTWSESTDKTLLFARYFLMSPVGRGGRSACKSMKVALEPENPGCGYIDPADFHSQVLGYNEVIKAGNPDRCRYFLHAPGGDSGKGGWANYQLLLDPDIKEIYTETNYNHTLLRVEKKDSSFSVKLNSSGDGGNGSIDSMDTAIFGTNSDVDATIEPESAPIYFDSPENHGLGISVDYTFPLINHGVQWGNTSTYSNSCVGKSGTSTYGKIVYPTVTSYGGQPAAAGLRWTYGTKFIVPTVGYGGGVGEQKNTIYEKLSGTLYMFPANKGDASSFVTTKLNLDGSPDVNKKISEAKSGSDGNIYPIELSLDNINLPIPDEFIELATPSRFADLSYIPSVMSAGFDNGLAACQSNFDDITKSWCPGFSGNGIYFYMKADAVPKLTTFKLENLFNKISITIDPKYETGKGLPGLPGSKPGHHVVPGSTATAKCFDGETTPTKDGLNSDNFASYKAGSSYEISFSGVDTLTYIPQYCKESKSYGNPGAVIIVW